MSAEILYPLSSVGAYINEDLKVYPMKNNIPNIELYSDVANLASEWVGVISEDDDMVVSNLISWNEQYE